jgi:ribose-phosphate pyrophosphokinase
MPGRTPIKVFSGSSSRYLAEKIVSSYGMHLGKSSVLRFSDGEIQTCFEETIRGDFVFIIQSTHQPIDNLFELLMMIDAARRASAYKIVAVIPYFGYARQDRKDRPRVSITSKMIANLLQAAGVDRIITMDLHADQLQGFFEVPVDHLHASSIFIPYLRSQNIEDLIIAAPDVGGSKRANAYASALETDLVICHKTRPMPNVVGQMRVIGDVKDKNVVLFDDLIDTAGTITKAAEKIMDKGAKSVRVFATHGVLSGPALERIEKSSILEMVITDTIPMTHESPKIKVLSVADLMADIIDKVYHYRSISPSFVM